MRRWLGLTVAVVAALLAYALFHRAQRDDAGGVAGEAARPDGQGARRDPHHPSGGWSGGGRVAGSGERPAPPDDATGGTSAVDQAATPADGFVELKVTARGAPVAGAGVRLYLRGRVDPNTALTDWRLAGAGSTSAAGVIQLAARTGAYLAVARAPGFAPGQRELRRSAGEPVTRAALELSPGAVLTGRTVTVARGSREPVALAALVLTPQARRGPFGGTLAGDAPAEEQVRGQSDQRGAFRVEGLGPGEWQVEARAPGFGKATERGVRVPRAGELVLELASASFLEGHVLAADGAPAGGAEVTAIGGREPATAIASELGAFSLEVSPRSWQLSARRGGESAALDKPVSVSAGQTTGGLVLRLGRASAIEGTVVAAGSGRAIASARIDVSPYGHDADSGRAVSVPDGSYAVEGLAPGSYDVVVSADGFLADERRAVTVLQGQRFPLRIELHAAGRVAGRVADSHAAAVEGAVVAVIRGFPSVAGSEPPETRTGPDGRYLLSGVAAGRVTLTARRDAAALGPRQIIEVREGEAAAADFTLADDGAITGRVSRKSGPLDGAVTVRAIRAQLAVSVSDFAATSTDAQGDYRLQLPPGSYRLFASTGPMRGGLGPPRDVVTLEGGQTVVKDLLLPDDAGDQATLTISVLEPGGAPAAGAQVQVTSAEEGMRFFMISAADEQGRMLLQRAKGDLPQALEVRAQNGGRAGSVRASREQPEITVQLVPGGRLEGHVSGLAAAATFQVTVAMPQGDARIGGFGGQGAETRAFTGDRFAFDDVAAGGLLVTVATRDGRSGHASPNVVGGQTTLVELALEQSPGVTGRVVDEQQKPVADAVLVVDGQSRTPPAGSDGRFSFDDLAPGEHRLEGFLAPLRSLGSHVFTLQPGQRLDLGDLVMPSTKTGPGGVGLYLRGDSEGVFVVGLIPGGPAESAGVAPGDQLALIDGVKVEGAADARGRLQGVPGSAVALTVIRNGTSRILSFARAP